MGKIAGVAIGVMLVGGIVMADTARPDPKGKTATVTVKKSVTLGGVTISFGNANHKHADNGNTLGMWTFIAKKGGKKAEIELRSDAKYFEAEVALHGSAFVFRHLDYETFTVTLAAAKAPKPLDDDACAEQVSDLARKMKYKEGSSRGYANYEGIVVVTSGNWKGYCGTLTKRMWIETVPDTDATK